MAEIQRATHGFVSTRPCGCVNFLSMDTPGLSKAARRETAERVVELMADGCRVERLPEAEVRAAAARFGYCDACRPQKSHAQGGLFT